MPSTAVTIGIPADETDHQWDGRQYTWRGRGEYTGQKHHSKGQQRISRNNLFDVVKEVHLRPNDFNSLTISDLFMKPM